MTAHKWLIAWDILYVLNLYFVININSIYIYVCVCVLCVVEWRLQQGETISNFTLTISLSQLFLMSTHLSFIAMAYQINRNRLAACESVLHFRDATTMCVSSFVFYTSMCVDVHDLYWYLIANTLLISCQQLDQDSCYSL